MQNSHKLFWHYLARLTAISHVVIMIFFPVGAVWALTNINFFIVHGLIVYFTIIINLLTKKCPLTVLEKHALKNSGEKNIYEGGFYRHYLFNQIFGHEVSEKFSQNLLIATKVVPGLIPTIFWFVKSL